MRITMGMASRLYGKSLSSSYERLNRAFNTNTTYRKFDSAYEDPLSSLKAYHLRQEVSSNSDYQANVQYLKDESSTQQSALYSMLTTANNTKTNDILKVLNDPQGKNISDRKTIAKDIRNQQAALLSSANMQFGGNYLFGGSGNSQPPFSVDSDGNLLYRGIDVNTGKIAAGTTASINGVQITMGDTDGKYDGYSIKIVNGTAESTDIDDTNKTITVTMDISAGRTNEDLLKNLKNHLPKATMTGDLKRPVLETAAGTSDTTAKIGNAQITLGDTAGTYNGYTLKIANGASSVAIDDASHTITVSMALNTDNTVQDVVNILKKNPNFANASLTGNPSVKVTAATSAALGSSSLPSSVATNTIGLKGLEQLANEKTLSDVGLGLSFGANNQIDQQSLFNSAIPGLSIFGYGTMDGTGTGVSNNLYTLMDQIADQLESESYSYDSIKPYLEQYDKQTELVSSANTKAGLNWKYLDDHLSRLADTGNASTDELDLIANVDTDAAYLDWTQKMYAYQACLKIGQDLLQQTVLDYMK